MTQHRSLFLILFAAFTLSPFCSMAQLFSESVSPIGLYEGLMGNSGAAISESMAPSYYNASLLMYRNHDRSYVFSGTSYDKMDIKGDGIDISSLSVIPGYIGSVIEGNALNHELFVYSSFPSVLTLNGNSNSGSYYNETYEGIITGQSIQGGYSLAVKSFPFGVSFIGSYQTLSQKVFSELRDAESGDLLYLFNGKTNGSFVGASIAFSTHLRFDSYTIGFNFQSPKWTLYKDYESDYSVYTLDSATQKLVKTESIDSDSSLAFTDESYKLTIGQGFRGSGYEFITDTLIFEDSDSIDKDNSKELLILQSFGMRVFSENEHQYLVGLKGGYNTANGQFFDTTYFSTGYSWKTRGLRSAFGIYHLTSSGASGYEKYGITYSTEMNY